MIISLTVPPPFEAKFLLLCVTFWFGALDGPDGALLRLRDFLYGWVSHSHQTLDEQRPPEKTFFFIRFETNVPYFFRIRG